MATGYLSPLSTVLQYFTDQGIVASGYELWTYEAGTTTPATTYSDSSLTTPNSNPIIIQSNGRLTNNVAIWAGAGTLLKYVLTDPNGGVVSGGTIDNVPLINDVQELNGDLVIDGDLTVIGTISSTGGLSSTTPAVTQLGSDSSTRIATTAWVNSFNNTQKIQHIAASVLLNELIITLYPTKLDFRSTTSADGTVTSIAVQTANIYVPAGTTLGTLNGISARLAVIAINNAGTVELGVINAGGGTLLDETAIINTSAISGGSSASTFYTNAARTGVAYRVVGYVDVTEATAGTWATSPTVVQGMGGNAFSGVNYGNMMPALSVYQTFGASAPHAPTSPTTWDFSGIPSWAKKITIIFNGVSCSSTSGILVQVGSGSIVSTGYVSAGSRMFTTVGTAGSTAGFLINQNAIGETSSGSMTLLNVADNNWSSSHSLGSYAGTISYVGGGSISLAGSLDRVRVTVVNTGTDSFDAGTVNILVE